jgi:Predicted hydrolases or acyltransferases (alpha/beta hydrolase superfamily)
MKAKKKNSHSIDKTEKLILGGVEQWISLRSDNIHNPIILFLHGGPGMAQIAFSRKSQQKLEKEFLVVNWDQRGAGKSFQTSLKKEDMSVEHFILDAEELVEALLQRFHQKKLFLVGHSWGTIIGASLCTRRPDLFYAYVGIGQIVDMDKGEKLSYQFTLKEAYRRKNRKAIQELKKIGRPPYKKCGHINIQRKWLGRFHGETYRGTITGMVLRNITIWDIGLCGLFQFIKGALFSLLLMEKQLSHVNLQKDIKEIKVPVFFCSGRRDYNVPFELVVKYMEKLRAPYKEMIWFEQSAHMPNFEEPDLFCEFCLSKLLGKIR